MHKTHVKSIRNGQKVAKKTRQKTRQNDTYMLEVINKFRHGDRVKNCGRQRDAHSQKLAWQGGGWIKNLKNTRGRIYEWSPLAMTSQRLNSKTNFQISWPGLSPDQANRRVYLKFAWLKTSKNNTSRIVSRKNSTARRHFCAFWMISCHVRWLKGSSFGQTTTKSDFFFVCRSGKFSTWRVTPRKNFPISHKVSCEIFCKILQRFYKDFTHFL